MSRADLLGGSELFSSSTVKLTEASLPLHQFDSEKI